MDATIFSHNRSHQHEALFGIYPIDDNLPVDVIINLSDPDVNITRTISRLTSPLAVTLAVLLVFLFSPMILIGNSLVLVAMYRFKRLRTPSNYLVMSLATSDLGIGMFMPIGMYLELGGAHNFTSVRVCLFSYGIAISLCCVSVLVMVAIAVDRFTSLARPLRYNNLITHSAVERYIGVFWAYASIVGFTPLAFTLINGINHRTADCSFGGLVAKPVQLFMFCAVYGPSALILMVCYGYIYFIARGHARAISVVRLSVQHSPNRNHIVPGGGAPRSRYGLALGITAGMFLGLWLPFQLCMLLDVFFGTAILSAWVAVYLALPILASSAFNPWVYGYRNAELRSAVRRVVDDILTTLGLAYRSNQVSDPIVPSAAATAGDHASFINHVQRGGGEGVSWKASDGDFLLVPIARPESSGVMSEGDIPRIFREKPTIVITEVTAPPPRLNYINNHQLSRTLRLSRSMVESFAVSKRSGSDVLVIKDNRMTHGASVV